MNLIMKIEVFLFLSFRQNMRNVAKSEMVLLRIYVNKFCFFFSLKIRMFGLYQKVTHDKKKSTNDKLKKSIDDELKKLCKIRICLCYRTEQGELKSVSNFVDTEIIEESES